MAGEMNSLCQTTQTNIIVSPLKNRNASAKVVRYVASLLSLPFVIDGTSEQILKQIGKVVFAPLQFRWIHFSVCFRRTLK